MTRWLPSENKPQQNVVKTKKGPHLIPSDLEMRDSQNQTKTRNVSARVDQKA